MFIKILIGLVALIAVLLLIAAFSKNTYTVIRSISVNRSQSDVMDYVRRIRNQDYYNKWVMADPLMDKQYRGSDGEVGFVYAWDSKNSNVGKGEQEIMEVTANRVTCEIRFERPFKAISATYMATEAVGPESTLISWSFHSKMPYPMNLMLLFVNMDKMLGRDIDVSLQNLKSELGR